MSTEATPLVETQKPRTRLRVWPALALLVPLVAARIGLALLSEWTRTTFMLLVFGPMVVMVAIGLWWLFASRAAWSDRFLGLFGALVIGGIAYAFADPSMKGMPFVVFVTPIAVIVLTAALILLSRLGSRVCTILALCACAIGFAYFDLVRFDGMSGDFKTTIRWRWQNTPEDEFLASRKDNQPAPAAKASEPLGTVTWSQFRGANRDGKVPGIVLDADWSARRPKEVWRRKVGPGWSSYAVAGNRLFTQEQRGDKELVLCYDAQTGEERWVHESGVRFSEAMGGVGPRATPTLSGGKLYAQGATGLLQCLDPLTGKQHWQRDLTQDAARKPPIWGFASSPLIVGGKVIVYAGGPDDKGVLAYDAETGKPQWGVAAGDNSYSSPQLSKVAGRDVVLVLTNAGLTAVDVASGKPAWNYDWKYENYRVVQPLLVDNSAILLGTGMGMGTRRIDLLADDKDVKFEDRWTSLDMKPDFNDYVTYDGYLYGLDHNILCCVDLKTGKKKWKNGRYGNGQILLLPDAGQLLVLSESGDLVLIRATPNKLEELARQKVLDGKTWNHPVLIGNRVFVRNSEEAACYEVPLAGQSAGEPAKTRPNQL